MVPDVTKSADPQNGCVWRQRLLCIVAYLPFFTHAIQEATIDKDPFFRRQDLVSETNVPWSTTASLCASVVSGPLLCVMADRCGRVYAVLSIAVVQIMTTVTCLLSVGSATFIYLLPNILLGVSAGGIYSVLPMYVREIGDPVMTSLMMMMTSLGQLTTLVKVDAMTMMYLQAALVVVQLMMMISLIETPSYLVMRGSEQRAADSLSRLRPGPAAAAAAGTARLRRESENARAAGADRGVLGVLRNRTWRNAAKLGIGLHAACVLGGSDLLVRGGEVPAHGAAGGWWAAAVPALMAAGAAAAACALAVVEIKYVLTAAFATSTLALGVLGVHMQSGGAAPDQPVVAGAAAAAAALGHAAAWGLPYVLMTEVLNLEIRATVIGFLTFYSQGLRLLQAHWTESVKGFVGVYTMCYMFAGINLFGGLYSLFGLPDVRNKSVAKIEKQLMYIPAWKF